MSYYKLYFKSHNPDSANLLKKNNLAAKKNIANRLNPLVRLCCPAGKNQRAGVFDAPEERLRQRGLGAIGCYSSDLNGFDR